MNRKKDVSTLSEDAIKKMIKKTITKMVSKRQQDISFEDNKLKIGTKIVADFSNGTSNEYITDIVYEEEGVYKSIIFPQKTYSNEQNHENKYYLLTSKNDKTNYFDSLTIIN